MVMCLMFACAPKSVPLTEESMNECERLVRMTERLYLDKSADEVLGAARRLFELAGGGYTVSANADGSLTAQRTWQELDPAGGEDNPDGTDVWLLKVEETDICVGGHPRGVIEGVEGDPVLEVRGRIDDCGQVVRGIRLTAYHIPSIYRQGIMPTECFSAPVFRPGASRFTVTPAIYNLFFRRIDYLLGKSDKWTDCATYSEYIRNNIHYRDQFSVINFQGHLDGLCARVDDRTP